MKLTAKQETVCRLLCLGFQDKAIADQMKLSLSGVRRHVEALFRKFHAHSRLGLAVLYYRTGNAGRNATGRNDTFRPARKQARIRSCKS